MTDAERIAQELVEAIDGFPQATKLEQEAAALLRSQAAEIERLREALRGFYNNSLKADWPSDIYEAARAALENKHD